MNAEIASEEQAHKHKYFCEKKAICAVSGRYNNRRNSQSNGERKVRGMDLVTVVRDHVIGEQGRKPLCVDANPDPNPIEVWVADEATVIVDLVSVLSHPTRLSQVGGHRDGKLVQCRDVVLMALGRIF